MSLSHPAHPCMDPVKPPVLRQAASFILSQHEGTRQEPFCGSCANPCWSSTCRDAVDMLDSHVCYGFPICKVRIFSCFFPCCCAILRVCSVVLQLVFAAGLGGTETITSPCALAVVLVQRGQASMAPLGIDSLAPSSCSFQFLPLPELQQVCAPRG